MKTLIDKLTAIFYILLIIGTIVFYILSLVYSVNVSLNNRRLIEIESLRIELEINKNKRDGN